MFLSFLVETINPEFPEKNDVANLNQILAIDITYERNKMIDNTQSDRDDN